MPSYRWPWGAAPRASSAGLPIALITTRPRALRGTPPRPGPRPQVAARAALASPAVAGVLGAVAGELALSAGCDVGAAGNGRAGLDAWFEVFRVIQVRCGSLGCVVGDPGV